MKKALLEKIETGEFLLKPEETFTQIKSVFASGAYREDPELEEICLKLLAGLAVYFFNSEYGREFLRALKDPVFTPAAKINSLEVTRYYLTDPRHVFPCLQIYRHYLTSEEPEVKDFACRSFLQTISEMRVGGQITELFAVPQVSGSTRILLQELSAQNWLEADELLDLLELN